MNILEAVDSVSSTGFFSRWMPSAQREVIAATLAGEESEVMLDLLNKLKARIETMPATHETNGQGSAAMVYLHYFLGSMDAWVTEKDVGEGECWTPETEQLQAFGLVSLSAGKENAEFGYLCIPEYLESGVELDLYWQPKALADI